jgi:hypothetical protein
LYAQGAFSGSDEDTFTSANPSINNVLDDRTDWDREEYSLAVGYAVTDSFVLFAGYRLSDTEFDTEFSAAGIPNVGTFTFDNEQDGPFVGANYGWRIEQGEVLDGTLALNLSAAYLDAEITSTFESRFIGLQSPGGLTGDTVGITAGVTWVSKLIEPTGQGLFANGLNYTLGIDGYTYDFEDDVDVGTEFSETVVRGSAGLSLPFEL